MAEQDDEAPKGAAEDASGGAKGFRRPLVIGAALMTLCAAGAFAAVSMGVVPGMGGSDAEAAEGVAEARAAGPGGDHGGGSDGHASGGYEDAAGVAFVPVEPLTVTLGAGAERAHLRFTSQLEVPAGRAEEVALLMPRIVDVLGGYLRALDPAMVEQREAHLRMRAQMLRRARLVAGEDAVRDLLVMEFVVN